MILSFSLSVNLLLSLSFCILLFTSLFIFVRLEQLDASAQTNGPHLRQIRKINNYSNAHYECQNTAEFTIRNVAFSATRRQIPFCDAGAASVEISRSQPFSLRARPQNLQEIWRSGEEQNVINLCPWFTIILSPDWTLAVVLFYLKACSPYSKKVSTALTFNFFDRCSRQDSWWPASLFSQSYGSHPIGFPLPALLASKVSRSLQPEA